MYLKIAAVSAVSASLLTAAMLIVLMPFTRASVTEDVFDWGSIRSAEAASSNALFLKVDGIPGSSLNSAHKDQIELLWYCFGFSSRADIPGCRTQEGKSSFDKTDFDGFHFIMSDNKATPKLMTSYLGKTPIKTITFYAQRGTSLSGGSDYLVVTLTNVTMTSYFHASNDEYRIPVVEASFNYDKIHIQYKEGSTTVQAGWDFKTKKPF